MQATGKKRCTVLLDFDSCFKVRTDPGKFRKRKWVRIMSIQEILSRIGVEETEDFKQAWEAVAPYQEELERIVAQCGKEKSFANVQPDIDALAAQAGVSSYSVYGFALCLSAMWLREDFLAAGHSEGVFWDSICDLSYKIRECRNVKKVWGIFSPPGWYDKYYQVRIFKLGRLEYEVKTYSGEPYHLGEYTVQEGDFVCNVHIPSSGPLTVESRLDSYRRAYAFFAEQRGNKPLVCVCNSWLLYPQHKEIFPNHLNMVNFLDDWDIIRSSEDPEFKNAWRLFDCDYHGDVSALPQDNTARRAMAKWLAEGKNAGTGFGVMLFDGEKILR